MITIFAPEGIGEVTAGAELGELIVAAVAADPAGPLRDGDVVVVTSKIVSKAEGRTRPVGDRDAAIRAETRATVARRGNTVVARTATGLTIAAAGVDTSNVDPGAVLLLPVDPDASAARLRDALAEAGGGRLAVVVSDTAGRPWRVGQTDHAIGAAGLRVLERYAGRQDAYGNDLQVTAMAVADEIAGAADLAKGKLAGRPVAVLRGVGHLVQLTGRPDGRASDLIRPPEQDMFGYGSREAVLAAALAATGQADRYEELVALEGPALIAAVLAGAELTSDAAALLARLLEHA